MSETDLIFENPLSLETIPDGRYAFFDEDDGSLILKSYANGKLNGTSSWHYSSGEPWIDQDYVDGEIHGETIYYNKDGTMLKREQWQRGVLTEANA